MNILLIAIHCSVGIFILLVNVSGIFYFLLVLQMSIILFYCYMLTEGYFLPNQTKSFQTKRKPQLLLLKWSRIFNGLTIKLDHFNITDDMRLQLCRLARLTRGDQKNILFLYKHFHLLVKVIMAKNKTTFLLLNIKQSLFQPVI